MYESMYVYKYTHNVCMYACVHVYNMYVCSVCMYVCMYVYNKYVCMYVHNVYVCSVCMCACMYVCMYVCKDNSTTPVFMHACMLVRRSVCIKKMSGPPKYPCMNVHACMHACACTLVKMHVCMLVCMWCKCMYVC